MTDTGSHVHPERSQLRVVVVDDHQLIAQSLAMALGFQGVSCTVAPLTDRATLIASLTCDPPDLVLLDLDLGAGLGDGSELVAPLVEAGSRVLVVSASVDQQQVCRALEQGATTAVRKDVPFAQLLETALAVARGDQVPTPPDLALLLKNARAERAIRADLRAPFRALSAREGQVLRMMASGQSVAEIAGSAFVSETTVRSQVHAILAKLEVHSQLQAVAKAHRAEWL